MTKVNDILQKYDLNGPYPQTEYVGKMQDRFKKSGLKFMNLVDKYFAEDLDLSK